MSSLSDGVQRRILDAALHLFARHGFRRTSMADIAREAQIARATLYLRFRDKHAVIRTLAETLVSDALEAARAAWQPGQSLADNIAATLLAKDLPLYRLIMATPHGAELLAIDADLTRAHIERLDAGFAALLTERGALAAVGGADLSAFGGPVGFAQFLASAGAGLKHETRTEAAFVAAIHRLAAVAARASDR